MAREVLPVVRDMPVLAGVCGTDPFRDMPALPRASSATWASRASRTSRPWRSIDGTFRAGPRGDRHGLRARGRHVREAGARPACSPRSYCVNADEAAAMALAGADVVVAHMGLTTKGAIGAPDGDDARRGRGRGPGDPGRRGPRDLRRRDRPLSRRPARRGRRTCATSSSERRRRRLLRASSMERLPTEVAIDRDGRAVQELSARPAGEPIV